MPAGNVLLGTATTGRIARANWDAAQIEDQQVQIDVPISELSPIAVVAGGAWAESVDIYVDVKG